MTIRASSLLLACTLATGLALPASAVPPAFSPDEAREAAVEAYLYAYPLVLMEVTRHVTTNGSEGMRMPMHQFGHMRDSSPPSLRSRARTRHISTTSPSCSAWRASASCRAARST